MKTDNDLREILQAAKDKAGSAKKWAEENGVSESSVKDALYRDKPFPVNVAKALGYKKERLWVLKTQQN